MRSPRHLVVTLVVVAALVLAVGLIIPRLTGSSGSGGAAANLDGSSSSVPQPGASGSRSGAGQPPAGRSTVPPTSLPTRITSLPRTPASAPPSPQALETATLWAKAWVNHPAGMTAEQWLNGLRPFTTEEQIAVMSTVDPANIKATEVTGPASATTSYTSSVEASLPTNGGVLSITVIATPQGWRVAHYEQAA